MIERVFIADLEKNNVTIQRPWTIKGFSTDEKVDPEYPVEVKLEHSRLAREDTLCRESMPPAERRWLAINRSPLARHWNLLTGLTVDQLSYAS